MSSSNYIMQGNNIVSNLLQYWESVVPDYDGTFSPDGPGSVNQVIILSSPVSGGGSGTGDVTGPSSSTDNSIVRFNGTSGKLIQNSSVTIDDSGNIIGGSYNGVTVDAHASRHEYGGLDELDVTGLSGTLTDAQKVSSSKNGTTFSTRPIINFIEGTNISLTTADDPSNNRANITINASIPNIDLDGYVIGPASSTDNTLPRFNGTTGKLIQGSSIVVDDSNNITGAGTINTVTITSHASRHNPGGSDAVATASASSLTVGGSNSEGSASSLARSDHTHALPAFGSSAGTFAQGNDSRFAVETLAQTLNAGNTTDGYNIVVKSGSSIITPTTSGTGENLNITAGNGTSTNAGGDINITAGSAVSGTTTAGDIVLQAGSLSGVNVYDTAGNVYIRGGTVNNTTQATAGNIYLQTYAGSGSSSVVGSRISLDVDEPIGDVQITVGTNDLFQFRGDRSNGSPSRSTLLMTNGSYSAEIFAGYKYTAGNASDLYISAGTTDGGASNTNGGNLLLTAGTGTGTGNGGSVTIEAGNGVVDGYVYIKTNSTNAAVFGPLTNFASASVGQVLRKGSNGALEYATISSGSGDVVGPASSTDNAIARFDLATGKLIQNSGVTIDDSNNISGVGTYNGVTITAHSSRHAFGGADELDVDGLSGVLNDPQKIIVRKNSGSDVGTRSRLNFIEGSNITLTVGDDAGNGEVDITIASTGGGSPVNLDGYVVGPASATDTAITIYNGTTGKLVKNSGITIDGSNNIISTGLYLQAATTSSASPPSNPTLGNAKIFSKDIGARSFLAIAGVYGSHYSVQPGLSRNAIAYAKPNGNSTTIGLLGIALSATGTATAANVATTNLHTQMRRVEYLVTTPSTTAVAGFRSTALQFFRGTSSSNGGFYFVCRWGPATGVSTTTNRAFVGLNGSASAPTDVQPSSLTNILGMGWDAADTNIQFMYNDGSGTASKIDLGIVVPTVDRTSVYELIMYCPSGSSTIYVEITDLVNNSIYTGSVNTDIPSTTQLLTPNCYMSVGGTSSVIGIALMSLYIETDN